MPERSALGTWRQEDRKFKFLSTPQQTAGSLGHLKRDGYVGYDGKQYLRIIVVPEAFGKGVMVDL